MPPRITHRIIDDIECKVCKGPLCKNDETPDGIWKSLDNFGIDKLWTYLEEQFEEGMTRENYGPVWHVDHIIPCNAFDLTKESEQRRCFNYRNLQPMFASANISKGDTYKFDIVKEIELHSAISKPT